MPIKPENKARYPKDWKAISKAIRERSGGRCECHGEPAKWAKGKIVLTVAHLDHTPENCGHDNLKAMCQRCHLRYDHDHHMKNASATRRKGKAVKDLFA